MPELPEVETIVRYLRPRIRGRRILRMESDTPRLFRDHRNFREVARAIRGKRINDVGRFGKNIALALSSGEYLLIHLMMTGQILLNPAKKSPHDRMRMDLSGGIEFIFNDIRKFGRIRLHKEPQKLTGPDALSVSLAEFARNLGRKNSKIKSALLDQRAVAGIGNIYADEALWHAGIAPMRRASSLSGPEFRRLYRACRKVLKDAINKEGTTMRNYRKPDDSEGGYYAIRKVYQRTGEKCPRDGAIIKRIIVGQRSTHYCPKHQK